MSVVLNACAYHMTTKVKGFACREMRQIRGESESIAENKVAVVTVYVISSPDHHQFQGRSTHRDQLGSHLVSLATRLKITSMSL